MLEVSVPSQAAELPQTGRDDTFVMYDRNTALFDGLFLPLKKGADRRGGYSLHYPGKDEYTADGTNLEVRLHHKLSTFDESVLLSALVIISQRGKTLPLAAAGVEMPPIWYALKPSNNTVDPTLVAGNVSYGELLRLLGKTATSGSRVLLKESLKRLTATTLWVTRKGGREGKSMVLLGVEFNDKTQLLELSIHFTLARAILNPLAGGWAKIVRAERNALRGDTAKSVHRRFSAWLMAGEQSTIGLATLEARIWGESSVGRARTHRFIELRKALNEINRIDGSFVIVPHNEGRTCLVYSVRRKTDPKISTGTGSTEDRSTPLLGSDTASAAAQAVLSLDVQTGVDALILASDRSDRPVDL